MIVRVFRVLVHEAKREAFEAFFRETAIPLVRGQPGLISFTAGTPMPDEPPEFLLVMVWRDLDAMKAFVGENWREAHVLPEEAELVRERSISHYTLATELVV